MKSQDLGLPIEYQQYPEYFDIPANAEYTERKNQAIEKLLNKYQAKSVLDMACGTGAQVFYLTKHDYQILGADFSPELIKLAKNKALKENIILQFIDGDMRYLQAGEFDAVITIDNAIGHLVKDDFTIAVDNIAKNLKSGGIYVFDILNLDAMTDEVIASDTEKMTNESITADGTILSNVRNSSIDREHGILTADETITINKRGDQKTIKNRCSIQIYTMDEINKILLDNSFTVVDQHKVDAYTFSQDDSGYSILTVAMKK